MSRIVKVAAAQYPLDFLENEDVYREKITRWVEEAAEAGAQILVFPEYAAMELASLAGIEAARDLQKSIEAVSERFLLLEEVHASLADRYGVTILAGSGPKLTDDGACNVASLFMPNGSKVSYQKSILTPWERDIWQIKAPSTSRPEVIDLGFAKVGIAICYEAEFPMLARRYAELGAEILLVSSNTDTMHGYWRVRTGCSARALENQFYVVQSPTIGRADWCPAVDINEGCAGIFAPQEPGLPESGVIALGEVGKPQWVYGDIDLSLIEKMRAGGAVKTYQDWKLQNFS